MARFNLNGLSTYTQAESLVSEDNAELAKQKRTFLRNSDRSFAWDQIAKYSGTALAAIITGISAGAAVGGAAAGISLWAGAAVAVAATISIGASYIAYKIRASNHINANEINASSTGREIAAELRKEPIEVSLSPPDLQQPNARPIQYFDTAGEAALLNDASNDKAYDTPSLQIATADAELLSRINEMDLEPLSHTR